MTVISKAVYREAVLKMEGYKTGATASAKQKPQSTVFESEDEGCFISNKSKAALPHASLVKCLSGRMLYEWRCSLHFLVASTG